MTKIQTMKTDIKTQLKTGYDRLVGFETTTKGYKWNDGVKNADGSYALNDTKGDGKAYKC